MQALEAILIIGFLPGLMLLSIFLRRLFKRDVAEERRNLRYEARRRKVRAEAQAKEDARNTRRRGGHPQAPPPSIPLVQPPAAPTLGGPPSLSDRLAQLDAAKSAGHLTPDEYAKARANIIAAS